MTTMDAKTAKTAKPKSSGKKIRVTLVKGLRGAIHGHRESVKGLGLKHRQHTVEVEDTPSIRGMINHASYLLKVEE
jgi:large subunit ribosomal protein L30